MKIETIGSHRCQLGEGPVWDPRRGEICWVDIEAGEIHQLSSKHDQLDTLAVNEKVGSFAICSDGNFVIAAQSGIGYLNRESGETETFGNPETHLPGNRFNDGKCDPAGRFWAGTMSMTAEPAQGSVYVLDNRRIVKKIENVGVSNGMAWSPDQRTLYYIDTPTREVVAYDYEVETGNISNKRRVVQVGASDGYPDGMTIDTEGMLWIAHWDGWLISRWDPKSGEKLETIAFPVSRVTSCTFGGNDLSDLFVTSARVGLTRKELEDQPLAGALFIVRDCGLRGLPAFEFNFA